MSAQSVQVSGQTAHMPRVVSACGHHAILVCVTPSFTSDKVVVVVGLVGLGQWERQAAGMALRWVRSCLTSDKVGLVGLRSVYKAAPEAGDGATLALISSCLRLPQQPRLQHTAAMMIAAYVDFLAASLHCGADPELPAQLLTWLGSGPHFRIHTRNSHLHWRSPNYQTLQMLLSSCLEHKDCYILRLIHSQESNVRPSFKVACLAAT